MTGEKQPSGDISKMLLEFGDAIEHERAKQVLQKVKQREARMKDLVTVRIDAHTVVLMEREKAIKKGYINE